MESKKESIGTSLFRMPMSEGQITDFFSYTFLEITKKSHIKITKSKKSHTKSTKNHKSLKTY